MRKNDAILSALQTLKAGEMMLCPTDSIYGISCDATNEAAVQKIIDLKGRSAEKSFIVLLNSDRMMNQCFKEIPDIVWDLIDYNDHPLTIILEGGKYVAPNVGNKDGSLGFRYIKDGPVNEILRKFNKPIVSTSPNISGKESPIDFESISPEITEAVDYVFPPEFAGEMTGQASKIISIGLDKQVKILRK